MSLPWLHAASKQFSQQLSGGRQSHAMLLCGPPGLGKRELARDMSAALLCLQPGTGMPGSGNHPLACGQCRSCQLFQGGAHPDFRYLSFIPKENSEELRSVIIVDQVRELIASMQLTNGLSPRKVALIYPAEAMNRNAANALLKTLEEPAGEVVLLLVSHDASRLSATIRSRCQAIYVRSPAPAEALDWLQKAAAVDRPNAQLALQAAAGSPLHAADLIKQGRVNEFRLLLENLQHISKDMQAVGPAFEQLFKLDPAELWNWLALASAEKVRMSLGAGKTAQMSAGAPANGKDLRRYADLHNLANRNRRLLSTPVRKDLLLRDWLIQWALPTSS